MDGGGGGGGLDCFLEKSWQPAPNQHNRTGIANQRHLALIMFGPRISYPLSNIGAN
jgi:hypothetical protein